MEAKIVKEKGVLFSTSDYSGMQIWYYNGSKWAIFKKQKWERVQFAYLWGKI